ncbi:MAG: hypothetical protein OEM91_11430 [Hyphomicrobiales bacterium]|nr:hypothetical protein [Hyphomicrobiales bacterium]
MKMRFVACALALVMGLLVAKPDKAEAGVYIRFGGHGGIHLGHGYYPYRHHYKPIIAPTAIIRATASGTTHLTGTRNIGPRNTATVDTTRATGPIAGTGITATGRTQPPENRPFAPERAGKRAECASRQSAVRLAFGTGCHHIWR